MTMAGGGGDAKTGSSGLRSCPDSRGGVWSAIAPSFTPLKRVPPETKDSLDEITAPSVSLRFGVELIKIQLKTLHRQKNHKTEHAAVSIVTSAVQYQKLCRYINNLCADSNSDTA